MSSPSSVLVYDGRKQAFRSAVDLLTYGIADLVAAPWESDAVQEFLEAQFGSRPFVFCLIDPTAVHVGEAAVRRALEARGIAPPVARGFERLYPLVADPFGRVVHGEAPADIHGSFRLKPEAQPYVDAIRGEHSR